MAGQDVPAPLDQAPVSRTSVGMAPSAEYFVLGGADFQSLGRHRGILAWRGAVAAAFGAYALGWGDARAPMLWAAFASALLADGVLASVALWQSRSKGGTWGGLGVQAAFDFAAAFAVTVFPDLDPLVVVYAAGLWTVLAVAAILVAASRFDVGAWPMALAAGAAMLLGSLSLLLKIDGMQAAAAWLGAFALVQGLALLALAAWLPGNKVSPRGERSARP